MLKQNFDKNDVHNNEKAEVMKIKEVNDDIDIVDERVAEAIKSY